MHIKKHLDQLEAYIPFATERQVGVSKADVGWHIDHTLKAIKSIYERLESSNPDDYHWEYNLTRMVVFTTRKIPRGKAKAPKEALPPSTITASDLKSQLEVARAQMTKITSLAPKSNIQHHVFGMLDLRQCLTLLDIHTYHHIKIIKDILKAKDN